MRHLLPRTLSTITFGLLAATATAQVAVVIPAGTANSPGSTANAFPWGWSAAGYGGLRHQCIYDASNFTSQSITYPILVTRLKWRPDQGASALAGGTFQQAEVRLSTAPMNYTQQTGNFATNHGADLTTVYSGAVVHSPTPGSTAWTPSSWCIDIQLTTPFLYDPALGDLVIDCEYLAGSWQGGSLGAMDVQGAGSMAGRTWGSTNYPNSNGTWLDHGLVVEVGHAPASGYAYSLPFGTGCIDRAGATFYETFPAGTFDLSNANLLFVPTGTGYTVVPTGPMWFTPTSPPMALGNNAVSAARPLGFPLSYPGGTTSSVYISSNGFVWAQSNTNSGCCDGDPVALLQQGARWCPLWTDLDPAAGGTVHFDTDPVNSAAFVTFTNVRENGSTSTSTFQVAFFASGLVEYRYQSCAVAAHQALTGWSPGAGNMDPGSIDISATSPILTEPDLIALAHAATGRPQIGTTIALDSTNVPATAVLGATLGGVTGFNPGLDLTSIGMPGCRQYQSGEAVAIWLPNNGVGTSSFAVPNNTGLAGLRLHTQGAAYVPGINALSAISSNGLTLVIDIQ